MYIHCYIDLALRLPPAVVVNDVLTIVLFLIVSNHISDTAGLKLTINAYCRITGQDLWTFRYRAYLIVSYQQL